jgi:hypothetical protein
MTPLLRAHETALKKKRRGWFVDPQPGLKDLRGKFEDAARHAGEQKIGSTTVDVGSILNHYLQGAQRFLKEPSQLLAYPKKRGASLLDRHVDPGTRANILAHIAGLATIPVAGSAALYHGGKRLLRRDDVKEAAIHAVLAKYALLDGGKSDVDEFTRIVKGDDFGYTKRRAGPPTKMRDEKPVWSPKTGLGAGWTADRIGAIANESYGGV